MCLSRIGLNLNGVVVVLPPSQKPESLSPVDMGARSVNRLVILSVGYEDLSRLGIGAVVDLQYSGVADLVQNTVGRSRQVRRPIVDHCELQTDGHLSNEMQTNWWLDSQRIVSSVG
eukprot:g6264.t1